MKKFLMMAWFVVIASLARPGFASVEEVTEAAGRPVTSGCPLSVDERSDRLQLERIIFKARSIPVVLWEEELKERLGEMSETIQKYKMEPWAHSYTSQIKDMEDRTNDALSYLEMYTSREKNDTCLMTIMPRISPLMQLRMSLEDIYQDMKDESPFNPYLSHITDELDRLQELQAPLMEKYGSTDWWNH